jgi:hypothetical protein
MMDHTSEHRLLDAHPGVRELVESHPEFKRWRARLPKVDVDGETFTVLGGDRLLDSEQLVVEWARQFQPALLGGK